MKNIILMSLFSLFMVVALSGQPLKNIMVASAFAGEGESDNEASNNDETSDSEQSGHDESNNHDSNTEASNSAQFQCPAGIAQCYSADGTEIVNASYSPSSIDINALPATAAGNNDDGEASHDSVANTTTPTLVNPTLPAVVAPQHFSSL